MDIGLLNEKPLHAGLKNWYAKRDDVFEIEVDGYFIDIIQDGLLVEIQTRNFSAIKRKVRDLAKRHPLRLVYPIAKEKWIVKLPKGKSNLSTRRKSPKRGTILEVFNELVSFPELLGWENFSLDVLLIQEEEVRRYVGKTNWRRRGWATEERRLLRVLESHLFEKPGDMKKLIPPELPPHFTTADLSHMMNISRRSAQQMAYCLRKMKAIEQIGKRGRSKLYEIQSTPKIR